MTEPSLLIETVKMIDVNNWNKFIQEVYGKPYNFQQQDGCKEEGLETFVCTTTEEFLEWGMEETEYKATEIPFKVSKNDEEMGVNFKTWLNTTPEETSKNFKTQSENELFWQRNFYPHIDMIAHDLYLKGLLEPGEYTINMDCYYGLM